VRGTGDRIPTVIASLREAGLVPAQFTDRIKDFRVTVPNRALLDADAREWLDGLRQPGLTSTQRMALALLRTGRMLTSDQYRVEFAVDSKLARAELTDLITRGSSAWSASAGGHGTSSTNASRQTVRPSQSVPAASAPAPRPTDVHSAGGRRHSGDSSSPRSGTRPARCPGREIAERRGPSPTGVSSTPLASSSRPVRWRPPARRAAPMPLTGLALPRRTGKNNP
jgi:hypothetical protein